MWVLSVILNIDGLCFFQNAALQHLFIRKSFRPFKCLQCGKAFREKDKLDQHLRFHGREGNCPLTCDICNKGFINSGALESHMKFHMDQKTYSCIFCPESFDRLDLLKDHVAIHVTDGYFNCPTCKKRFPDFIQVRCHPDLKSCLLGFMQATLFKNFSVLFLYSTACLCCKCLYKIKGPMSSKIRKSDQALLDVVLCC